MTKSTARGLLGAPGLLLGAALAFAPLPASPAGAASSDILVSQDGVHWSHTLSSEVFDTSRMLVPGDTLQGEFYVKNAHSFPAYLRVGLSALSVTSWTLAEALSLTTIGTGSSGASGSAAAFSGPGVVCSDLLQREDPVPPGGIVLVSADLMFRQSTSGRDAQGEIAQIAFILEFSDVDLNAYGQPLCTNTAQIGPFVPTPPTPGGGTSTGTPPTGGVVPGAPGTPGSPGAGTPGAPWAGGAGPGQPGGPGTSGTTPGSGAEGAGGGRGNAFDRPASAGTIDVSGVIGLDSWFFNTVRWWEEYAILILIGAVLIGMLGRVYAERWLADRRQGAGAG